ncbi:MAG: transcriptional regulator [Bacteroidia bacterium]|nr:transcriptional regulator [Bacteroidia bacterium]
MLYELAHTIKDKCAILWDMVEWGNATLFSLVHHKALKDIPTILSAVSTDTFSIRPTLDTDAPKLARFFSEQPAEAFTFFKPHKFDEKSVLKVLRNRAFMTFVVLEGENIVGYFFLRSFVNGKCFKGRMVDSRQRNRGIAKLMGIAINRVAVHLGMRIFTTISPENYASLASTKAVNDIKIVKTLENGYYYIECTPKSQNDSRLAGG